MNYSITRGQFFSPPPRSAMLLFSCLLFALNMYSTNIFDTEQIKCQYNTEPETAEKVVEGCGNLPIIGNPNKTTLVSKVPLPLPPSFKIVGTLVIDINFSMTGNVVKMVDAASIQINPQITFTVNGGTVIEGCETMWKGISLDLNSTLNVDGNSEINDAVNAITVTKPGSVNLRSSQFKRNFRSLMAYSPTTSNLSFDLFTSGIVVDGAGPLKPPHSQQPFYEHGPKAESGFRFIRCNTVGGNLKVGRLAELLCTFRNCVYGVTAANSNLVVENCRFEEMDVAGNSSFGGHGIYGENGYFDIQKCNFFHCLVGISLYRMNFLVTLNHFSRVEQAVYAQESNNQFVAPQVFVPTVSHNVIEGANYGFVFFQNNDSSPLIHDNDMDRISLFGIMVTDQPGLPNRSYIHTNLIKPGSAGGWKHLYISGIGIGIQLTGTRYAAVCKNTIIHDYATQDNSCIIVENCSYLTITNNTVRHPNPIDGGYRVGISCRMTNGSTIDCNKFTNPLGLEVRGVCTSTAISTNTFVKDLYWGMYFINAATQDQVHTGNRWTYTTTASNPGARYLGTGASSNLFYVDGDEDPELLPYVQSQDPWFIDENTPENTITCNPGGNICSVPPPFTGDDDEVALKIINERIPFDNYKEASAWLASRQGLSWMITNGMANSLTKNPSYSDYWVEMSNTSQGKLGQLEADAIAWKDEHAQQAREMGALWVEMMELMNGADQSEAALERYENKRQQLETLRATWDADYAQFLADWATVNATLPEAEIFVKNQKQLNALMLNLHGRNPMRFTNAEKSMLQTVAGQCSFEGGPAVLQARNLLSLEGETRWNDADLCGMSALTTSTKAPLLENIQVSPNPTTGAFNLTLPQGISTENTEVFLYDMTGRMCLHQKLQSATERIDVTGKVENGLYLLEIRAADGSRIGLSKVIVQK